MQEIKVTVKGSTGTGKSHVLAIIEKALIAEYGPLMKVTCDELVSERNLIGANLDSWNKPNPYQVCIKIVEENVPVSRPADLKRAFAVPGAYGGELPIPAEIKAIINANAPYKLLLVDCIDPGLAPAIRTALEEYATVTEISNPASGLSTDIKLRLDSALSNHVFNLMQYVATQPTDPQTPMFSVYVTDTTGINPSSTLLSIYRYHREAADSLVLHGLNNSPHNVNELADKAWKMRSTEL